MGAGQSSPSPSPSSPSPSSTSSTSSTSVCDFSNQQIPNLNQEIKKIDDLIMEIRRNKEYDNVVRSTGAAILMGGKFAIYMSNLGDKPFEDKNRQFNLLQERKGISPLILNHLLYAQVKHILEEYKAILETTQKLCETYQSNCVGEGVVETDIDEIISKNFSNAQTHLFLFNRITIPGSSSDTFENAIAIIKEINERFSDIDKIKSEMKTICAKQKVDKDMSRSFFRAGGTSSRSRSKKRKQMKMKMSKPHSKTKHSKKRYNKRVKE